MSESADMSDGKILGGSELEIEGLPVRLWCWEHVLRRSFSGLGGVLHFSHASGVICVKVNQIKLKKKLKRCTYGSISVDLVI